MPTAFVLCLQDLGRWQESSRAATMPGGELPYGLGHLRPRFELDWDDRYRRGAWASRPPRLAGGLVRRAAPGLAGSAALWTGRAGLRRADVALSVFENMGLGLGRLRRLAPALAPPHVMVVCWLAEDCAGFSPRERRSVARSLRSVDRVLVFSRNQVAVLCDAFGLGEDRVQVVPFGVDTDYYAPARVEGSPGGGGLVAVGSDSRRDYATLLEAVRRAGVALTLACQPRNLAGLTVPPGVTVVSRYGAEYRRLLHEADLVVTPTTAPAYPSGQSVVLEAMAMERATLTTDSPAMRDYVRDGLDGVLVPVRDQGALAEALVELLADEERRQALGREGRRRVAEDFSLARMWGAVGDVISDELRRRSSPAATGPRPRRA